MHYLEFLERLHRVFEPRTYLEIGVRNGNSLSLSRAPSIGIDPRYELTAELGERVALFRQTSDEYFAAHDPVDAFGGEPVDLAFIDGMHLIEFALRDFINVERHSHPGGLVVLDDVFPPSPAEAARKRRTQVWTGDVFKIVDVLGRERADLGLLTVDTEPTGLMLVFRLDPGSERLADRYGAITSACVAPDPQRVPEDMLARLGAASPEEALSAPLWAELRGLRPASPSRCSAASGGAGGPAPRSADASRRGKPCPRP
ncbi:MAG: class I SAM-dependent methyltransferase [Solirubrobacterales bacterium]